jgi:hypothetical protein
MIYCGGLRRAGKWYSQPNQTKAAQDAAKDRIGSAICKNLDTTGHA